MNAKNILFPTDFSHSSDAALSFASSLAAESGAVLHLVHVGNSTPSYISGYYGFDVVPDQAEKLAKENCDKLEKIKPTVTHVNCQRHYLTGAPDEEILAFAEREHIDLIVLGSHGRTGLSRLLLGSVAESVVRGANCPVLTVKQPVSKEQLPSAEKEAEQTPPLPAHPAPIARHSLH